MGKSNLLERLKSLSPPQFEEVMYRFEFPEEYISRNKSFTEIAINLILYAESHSILDKLSKCIDDVSFTESSTPVSNSSLNIEVITISIIGIAFSIFAFKYSITKDVTLKSSGYIIFHAQG